MPEREYQFLLFSVCVSRVSKHNDVVYTATVHADAKTVASLGAGGSTIWKTTKLVNNKHGLIASGSCV